MLDREIVLLDAEDIGNMHYFLAVRLRLELDGIAHQLYIREAIQHSLGFTFSSLLKPGCSD